MEGKKLPVISLSVLGLPGARPSPVPAPVPAPVLPTATTATNVKTSGMSASMKNKMLKRQEDKKIPDELVELCESKPTVKDIHSYLETRIEYLTDN